METNLKKTGRALAPVGDPRRIVQALTLSIFLSTFAPTPTAAFELFGYQIGLGGIKKQQSVETSEIADPVFYSANLQSDNDELTQTLEAASLLIGQQEKAVSGTAGLLARARSDQKRLVAALYKAGRYGGVVEIFINERPLSDIPVEQTLKGTPDVRIAVASGPVFVFGTVAAADATQTPLSLAEYGIIPGQPALSDLVLDAEEKLIARYKQKGFPFAQIATRDLEADHDSNQLDLTLIVDTGAQARFGAVSVEGAKDVEIDFIVRQADLPQDALYSSDDMKAATRRLRALGLFDSVLLSTADAVDATGRVPVRIEIKERKARTIGVGVTMGNIDGIGLEGFWTHRNLFGQGERLRVEGSVSRIAQEAIHELDYHAAVLFSKPGVFGPSGTFESELSADSTNSDAFSKRSVSGELAMRYDYSEQISGRVGVASEYARVRDKTGTQNSLITSLPLELLYDERDSKLDPTQGFLVLLTAEPTYSTSSKTMFLKNSATVSAYQALDEAKRFVMAGRISAGSIVGASKSDVPTDRRFFTGGGGSIRGYGFQAAGPRDASNDPTGGLSYATASLEARMRVTETIGLAAFIDTGGSFNSAMPDLKGKWYTGFGAGIRYLTPIGPLRLDVAVPLEKIRDEPHYGVYLGLGQAF